MANVRPKRWGTCGTARAPSQLCRLALPLRRRTREEEEAHAEHAEPAEYRGASGVGPSHARGRSRQSRCSAALRVLGVLRVDVFCASRTGRIDEIGRRRRTAEPQVHPPKDTARQASGGESHAPLRSSPSRGIPRHRPGEFPPLGRSRISRQVNRHGKAFRLMSVFPRTCRPRTITGVPCADIVVTTENAHERPGSPPRELGPPLS